MEVSLLSYQWEALHSKHKFTLLLGGIGSGKSYTGSPWVLKQANEFPNSLGLITANTFGQLQKATLASLFRNLTDWGISFSYNQQKSLLTIHHRKQFLCLGLDSFDNHRGIEVGEWWGDEVAYNKREAFEVMSGRLRDSSGSLSTLFTTTPKGFNWLYDYFHPSGENHDPNLYRYVKARSYDNKHLPEGYLDSLAAQYDEKLAQQELEGEFVSITQGQAYYAFDRDKHVHEFDKPHLLPYSGNDFNIDPMTCVIGYATSKMLFIWDERFLRNTDTYGLARQLRPYSGLRIIPDSTAKNRKTSGRSDIQILEDEGFEVIPTRNPYVTDRVNNLNRLFSQGRIVIHPRCKKLINDLEKVCWMEGKIELDQKTDRMLTHISDGLGYMAWKLFNPTIGSTKPGIRMH